MCRLAATSGSSRTARLAIWKDLDAAADLPRLRHGIVAGRAWRTRLSAVRQRGRVVRRPWTRRQAARCGPSRERIQVARTVRVGHAVHLEERTPHGDCDHWQRHGGVCRLMGRELWRLARHDTGDAVTGGRRRPAVCGVRIAGRTRAAGVRGQARRNRRHFTVEGSDEQRVCRVVPSAALGLHAVAAPVSRPRVCYQRQRHHAGGRRQDGQGTL